MSLTEGDGGMSQFLWSGSADQTTRRKFVWMALSVPAAMALPSGLARPAFADADPDLQAALAAVSPPRSRSAYFTIHHVGVACTHTSTRGCAISGCNCSYDFVIQYDGRLTVCSAHTNTTGSHAIGCNCNTLGVLLAGCFGCSGGGCTNPTVPCAAQECTLASLMLQVGSATSRSYTESNLIPHRNCYYWRPCGGSPTSTVCPGATLTQASGTNSSWSSTGLAFRSRVLSKYRNLVRCCTCSGNPCCA
jgi:hypothetical protein